MSRYFVKHGSDSGHCCFEASIMDSLVGEMIHGDFFPDCVCECFDEDVAEEICKTLNEKENS